MLGLGLGFGLGYEMITSELVHQDLGTFSDSILAWELYLVIT